MNYIGVDPTDIMADKHTGPIHQHESFFDRIFHPHKSEDKDEEYEHEANDPTKTSQEEADKDHMKDEDKFKDRMHKEGQLESQGEIYDYLM
ncbi:hypothetical protein N7520_010882 [Penicillium odoratum]|uniref:uncharacterized protein n=1 Tax=Penicillium odoratum TaxID=1167516 RepID=UPI002549264D|nr:uncharacterized protein N7520_010882 [Penicillium odoratum]KAJ5745700.1 hypothetical protein N7520_010882 [Penicillium odoratum]